MLSVPRLQNKRHGKWHVLIQGSSPSGSRSGKVGHWPWYLFSAVESLMSCCIWYPLEPVRNLHPLPTVHHHHSFNPSIHPLQCSTILPQFNPLSQRQPHSHQVHRLPRSFFATPFFVLRQSNLRSALPAARFDDASCPSKAPKIRRLSTSTELNLLSHLLVDGGSRFLFTPWTVTDNEYIVAT